MDEFRDNLLKYLFVEKKLIEEDAKKQKNMSREEKVEQNLLLVDVTIKKSEDGIYELNVPNNYSKLRIGDKINITNEVSTSACEATIIDTYFDTLTIACDKQLDTTAVFSIEQESPALLQALISCLEGIYSGVPGAAFLRLLSGEEKYEVVDFLKVPIDDIPNFDSIKNSLNKEQLSAVASMLEYPPIHVLQGPPGTGKTAVLAATAIATSRLNREVVIIANTHHAVNNALQKIRSLDPKAALIKVGPTLKSEELDDTILKFEKFNEYYEFSYKNRKKKKTGHIIGMTIWGAITHLGLRHHAHFRPYISLVDEASLMPLSYAAILGKTAPSVCLFGDSRQMPPIFRPELESNDYSISILDYCSQKVEGIPASVLHTTYRMNEEITSVVSKSFYEPYGIKLISSESAKDKKLIFDTSSCNDTIISDIFGNEKAIHIINVSKESHEEENIEEALFAAQCASVAIQNNVPVSNVAIITPFRKQVNAIHAAFKFLNCSDEKIPIVDTVERLQGQDVGCIIISFASSAEKYIESIAQFIYNPNRLNVMISRAKTKVIILASDTVQKRLKEILMMK